MSTGKVEALQLASVESTRAGDLDKPSAADLAKDAYRSRNHDHMVKTPLGSCSKGFEVLVILGRRATKEASTLLTNLTGNEHASLSAHLNLRPTKRKS